MSEDRRYRRRELPIPSNVNGMSYVSNISMGGAFIKTTKSCRVGTSFGLTIKLPVKGSPPLRANCIVRWVTQYGENADRPWGIGVEFKDISSKSREYIRKYIQLENNSKASTSRRFKRNTVEIKMDYRTDGEWVQGVSGNVSQGGVFIASDTPPEIGQMVDIQLYFPRRDNPISARGKVRWINEGEASPLNPVIPQGAGVQFKEITSEDEEFISKYLAEKKSARLAKKKSERLKKRRDENS